MFEEVTKFEEEIAKFYGAPFAIATDSCTHAIELALRYTDADEIEVPHHTYLSIPFLAHKLRLGLKWRDIGWIDYYFITKNVVDAAVLWKPNSYLEHTYMGISFQYQKHLSLGRGGMLLLDNPEAYTQIKKMSYDGRLRSFPWRAQDIDTVGYHYYMTPETAQLGLDKLQKAIDTPPKQWEVNDWPDLTQMEIFKRNF